MEDGARNFLFIFGKPKEEWEVIAYRSTSHSSAGSANLDELLNSYEQYVDKYIALLKKANKGDSSALSEYLSFLEQAQELSEQLSDAEDELTPEQMKRYLRTTNKMAQAAASAH